MRAAPRRAFRCNGRAELGLLRRRQIVGFIFPIQGDEPDLVIVVEEVIDHAQAAAFSFPPAIVTPAQLPKSAGARHDVAGLWLIREKQLKRHEALVVQIGVQMARKRRCFEKLHACKLYAKCVEQDNGRRTRR